MEFEYKDVWEFQKKHKTRKEREEVLKTLTDDEIWHIAKSCGTPQGGAYYASFLKEPNKYKER